MDGTLNITVIQKEIKKTQTKAPTIDLLICHKRGGDHEPIQHSPYIFIYMILYMYDVVEIDIFF